MGLTLEAAARQMRIPAPVLEELEKRGRIRRDKNQQFDPLALRQLLSSNEVLNEVRRIREQQRKEAAERAEYEKSPSGLRDRARRLRDEAAKLVEAAEIMDRRAGEADEDELLDSVGAAR
jgi:hypothetical protein